METNRIKILIVGILLIVGIAVIVALMPFTVVSASERAVVLKWGVIDRTLDPGIHWVTPIQESVVTFNVSTQKEEVEASAASKDIQAVSAKIAVNYTLDPSKVDALYREFKGHQDDVAIVPAIKESVKAATAKYTAEELITKREAVKEDMLRSLKESLAPKNILVADVYITDFDFSAGFNASIEAKVKATQDALKAENDLRRVKFEAEQKVAQAQAEAQSIRLQSEAANNEKYVSLKRLDVQMEFAKRWNGQLPVNLYAGAPIPFIDIK